MLEATDLVKHYQVKEKSGWLRKQTKTIQAVGGLSLQINRGEIIGLLGVNGSGKTTTIKMLASLLLPSSGTIRIDGLDALTHSQYVKQHVNMISGGERMLYWRLNAKENLMYFGSLYGMKGKMLKSRCDQLIDLVGLREAADIPVERYSKGMKQRLQIARGLINDPDYLFLDEPTLGLDAPVAKQLRQTVRMLARERNKGILLTSHYLEEVEVLCDRVYIIEQGKLLLQDTPENIIQQVVKNFHLTATLEQMDAEKERALSIQLEKKGIQLAVTPFQDEVSLKMTGPFDFTSLFIAFITEQKLQLKKLETSKPKLEDAILQLAESSRVS